MDDEADTRELLRQGLEYCGATVSVAGSAAEAGVEAITAKMPDILISDIGMPGLDGYDLIQQVRRLPAANGGKLPAIALTAYTRTEDRLQALRAGYDMHVPKPVELLVSRCGERRAQEPKTRLLVLPPSASLPVTSEETKFSITHRA